QPYPLSSVLFQNAIGRFSRLVILGGPGAGKTTTLSYTLLQFAQGRGSAEFGIHASLLPIFVPLRRLSPLNLNLTDDILDSRTKILPSELLLRYPRTFFERKLR